jgi:penicillin-binding protein 1C
VLVLEVETGAVLAYAGNLPDPEQTDNGHVDMIVSLRSTGSVLKPFLYADLFEAGELLPGQLVADVPTRMGSFIPENNTRSFSGAVPAREALARSLNVPAVRLLRSYGLERFYDSLKALGMSSLDRPPWHYGLTLIIGGAEASLWDLTGMYAGLARTAEGLGGFHPPSYLAAPRSTQPSPAPVSAAGSTGVALPGPGAAWLTLEALLEVERPGEEGAWREYLTGRRIAWKTGTSYGFRDAWALGVTRRYAVGVWVGNATGVGRAELRGATAAAPLLFDVFNVLGRSEWFAPPQSDLTLVRVCAKSGYLAGPFCEETATEVVARNGAQSQSCPFCREVHLDATGRYRSTAEAEGMSAIRTEKWFVLPPAMEWYYKRSHGDYRPLPPMKPGAGVPVEPSMAIVFPESGGRVYVPIELDGTPGKTVFHATHRDNRATIYWHLDGEYLGATTELHFIEARPSAGRHLITIVDDEGEELTREFICLSEK